MKQIFNSLCIFACLIFAIAGKPIRQTTTNAGQAPLIFLTYNVRNCVGLDNVVDYERVGNAISKINPDIVALQELDSSTARSKHVDVLGKLAGFTGLTPTFHASIDYDGGKYGIGILSKEKPLSIEGIALPGSEEKRSAVAVEMKNYVFVCTHFSLTETDRLQSVALLNMLAAKYTKPVFLAGDLNTNPRSPVIDALSKNWQILSDTTKMTIPANKPVNCIDYIMVRKQDKYRIKVLDRAVGDEPVASDHLPVWVQVQIGKK